MYAILSHGGRQYRVSAGDRLVVDRLEAEVGSVVALEPVLLTAGDGSTTVGAGVDGMRVAVTVVAHRRGEKLRIFKYKAKKRSRKVAGYRSDLTELRVESILAKGASLPRSTATPLSSTDGAAATSAEAPRGRRRPAAPAATSKPEVIATAAATRTTAGAAKRASSPAPKPKATDGAPSTKTKAAAAPAKPATKAKAAPKRGTKDDAAARDKEKGDGA